MLDTARRWLKLLTTTRKGLPFHNSGETRDGMSHVGSLVGGYVVYSTMRLRASTPQGVVFTNGSYIRVTSGGLDMNIAGSATVVMPDGSVVRSGA